MQVKRFSKLPVLILTAAVAIFLGLIGSSSPVSALSGADFNAARIIDDIIFFNPYTMSPDDIQVFLNAKVPTCDTNGTQTSEFGGGTRAQYGTSRGYPPPYICLKDYSQSVPTTAGDAYCSGGIAGGTKSAASIIMEVAIACSVNPKVLIVTLQKEQNLVTDDWPWSIQYRSAMGYGCPDTAECDSQYYGFFNQVYNAARQFQRYAKQPDVFNHGSGRTSFVSYQANRPDCGGTNLFMQNQATAGLYNYTPYQPNQAALNNLYGLGDGCSAHGNRNFWRLFNDWFGSSYSNDTFVSHPDGALLEMNHAIFLVDNHVRRHIRTPSIFDSYGYKWSEVRRAVAGDYNLPEGMPLEIIKPGKLFRTPTSSVYTMIWDSSSSAWVKQMVTYDGFINLGYRWDEVLVLPYGEFPSGDYATHLSTAQHPSETLIRAQNDSKVYMLDSGTRRYVPRPEVLYSYNYWWTDIKTATTQDNLLPIGADMPYREGSVLYDGSNLYITDLPLTGNNVKRPIAPWECFSDRLSYRMNEVLVLTPDALPVDNGPIIYC